MELHEPSDCCLFVIVSTALFGQLAEFEVASVRLHAFGVPGSYPPTGGVGTDDPQRIVYNGFTLGDLLLDAFDFKHSWRIPRSRLTQWRSGTVRCHRQITAGAIGVFLMWPVHRRARRSQALMRVFRPEMLRSAS
jgi:hypothetical protein